MTDATHDEPPSAVVMANADAAANPPTSNVPEGYRGPVHNSVTGQTYWAGSQHPGAAAGGFTLQGSNPDGHRLAHNQWTFAMTGGIAHHVPQNKWTEMDNAQKRSFDSAGRLSFGMNLKPGNSRISAPAPMAAIEAGGDGSVGVCSGCGGNRGVKKFATHGGLMRPLCGDCVYDRVGGEQGAYQAEWSKGHPL